MEALNIPIWATVSYGLLTLLTIYLFARSHPEKFRIIFVVMTVWAVIQWVIASSGFYLETTGMPPRPFLMFAIPVLTMIVLFATKRGRVFIDSLSLRALTGLHVVRVPVELFILYWFMNDWVPELMTFEGRNFDILMGITAPVIAMWAWRKPTVRYRGLLIWNIVGLLLLMNIVVHAVLSLPVPFQQLAFDQPNVAVLHFPFNALPSVIVQIVLFSHLVAIRRCLSKNRSE
jgi:hypothetical protein